MSTSSMHRRVHVGCASGFWGDSQLAMPQLLTAERLDYIVFDYLAETTMSILQRARLKKPELGYATDFVSAVVKPHLKTLLERRVRLVANAGGLNPEGCRDAILAVAAEQGLSPKVAIVTGDDVSHLANSFRANVDGDESGNVPADLMSANAYLGAYPIVEALKQGADIVITGRGVDSAPALAIAAFEHGWSFSDYDRMAQACLAGHLIECGAQATGGIFTDWDLVPDWANIGYPIVSIESDGSFLLSKPAGTGGLINPAVVSEQLLYEIGDPGAYALPDVICDFRQVAIDQVGPDLVRVSGARGRAPSSRYKVTVTSEGGFQLVLMMAIRGMRARAKAQRTAEELLRRTRSQMHAAGLGDYTATTVEYLGAEALYGPHALDSTSREIVLRIGVQHPSAKALGFLQKESASAGTSMGPGTRSHFGGRSSVQSVIKSSSFYIDKSLVPMRLQCGAFDQVIELPELAQDDQAINAAQEANVPQGGQSAPQEDSSRCVRVSLAQLAYARSGDKGEDSNIGVIARDPKLLPLLRRELSEQAVRGYFAHLMEGDVTRFELPGINALNFVLRRSLGGGGSSSLRSDPLGKCYAQMLLDLELACPVNLLPTR